ncbi:MAG: dockerin type I repeat-containing protein [Dehalococcoidia bacterium]
MLNITRSRVLIAVAFAALLLLAYGLVRAVGPTYGSDVDGTWGISVTPGEPIVGDMIEVRARARGTQSPTMLSWQIEQDADHPVVELIDNTFGYEPIVTFEAVGPGIATISGTAFFEKPICPPPTPTPNPTPLPPYCFPYGFYLTTPDIVIEVAPSCGDTNSDALVNSLDAAWILQYAAGMIQTLVFPANADVNDDGAADSVDAAIVLQFHAALLPPDALRCPPPMIP